MKFVMVCPDWFPNISGFALSCYEFSQELIKMGHEVVIVVPKIKGLDSKGMRLVKVPMIGNVMGRNPVVVRLLSALKKESSDADVIVMYSYMYEMNVRIAFFRKIGLIKKPLVLMYRGSLEQDVTARLSFMTKVAKKFYDATFARFLFKNVDRIISNSKPTLKIINDMYGVSNSKLAYVNSAVYVDSYKISSCGNKRVTFIGRLIENKGIELFPKILRVIPKSWEFCVIGDGPMTSVVENMKKDFPNIVMLGKQPLDKVKDYLGKSDILVLPTYAEGSPRVVLEALSSGVPCVSFAVGDVENVLPKGTGFSIKPFEIETFCDKVQYLVKNDKERKEMGKSAHAFAKKQLDWPKVAKKMVDEIKVVS